MMSSMPLAASCVITAETLSVNPHVLDRNHTKYLCLRNVALINNMVKGHLFFVMMVSVIEQMESYIIKDKWQNTVSRTFRSPQPKKPMKTIYRCEATIVAVSMQKTALHLLHHLRSNLHIKWLENDEKSCKKPFFKDDCIFCQIAAKALKRKKRIGSSEDGEVKTFKVFHWIRPQTIRTDGLAGTTPTFHRSPAQPSTSAPRRTSLKTGAILSISPFQPSSPSALDVEIEDWPWRPSHCWIHVFMAMAFTRIRKNSSMGEVMRAAKLIIWDEVTMAPHWRLSADPACGEEGNPSQCTIRYSRLVLRSTK